MTSQTRSERTRTKGSVSRMRATGGQNEREEQSLEGILPHPDGDLERVGVGDIADAGIEMRAWL